MNARQVIPGPTGRALLSGMLAIGLVGLLFLYVREGAYTQAVVAAFFAIVNVDAGLAQWRQRGDGDVIA